MRKTAVLFTVLGLSLATLFLATSTARAQGDASGRVTLESTSIAIGAGVSWGDGVLEYRGGGGEGMAALKNQNGVEMALTATTRRLAVAPSRWRGRRAQAVETCFASPRH